MSDIVLEEEPAGDSDEGGGVPAWVMTFADLMTLLMCFFVLLLAFSEMDVMKFKQLSGSVREAFGVQTIVEAKTIPKGTSVIAQEFSPGIPEPTPLNEVRQYTVDSERNSLDFEADDEILEDARRRKEAELTAESIRAELSDEIEGGDVAVRLEGTRIVIQLLEKATFRSGYADLSSEFEPVLRRISELIATTEGTITISGHSDNVPIHNERFRSNWELSTARAVTVLHALTAYRQIAPERFVVTGHADTRPLEPNDSWEQRALNRRVDISVVQGDDDEVRDADSLAPADPDSTPTGDAADG